MDHTSSLSNNMQASASKRAGDFQSQTEAHQDRENEENTENGSSINRSVSKRMKGTKIAGTPSPLSSHADNRDSFPSVPGHVNDSDSHNNASINSDTENENDFGGATHDNISDANASPPCQGASVQKLKGWLSDFEQQQKAHFEKNNNAAKVTRFDASPERRKNLTTSEKSSKPSIVHSNQTKVPAPIRPSSHHHQDPRHSAILPSPSVRPANGSTPCSSMTPLPAVSHAPTPGRIRFTPRIKKDEVQATNDRCASVGKLSAWLADDPFEKQKELRVVRRGAKVVSAARVFEPLPQNDATRTIGTIKAGNVLDRKEWLQNAFKNNGGCEETSTVSERAKWLQTVFKPRKDGNPHSHNAVDSLHAYSGDKNFSSDHDDVREPFDGSSGSLEFCSRSSTNNISMHGEVSDEGSHPNYSEEKSVPVINAENTSACLNTTSVSNASTDSTSDASTTSSFSTGKKMVLQGRIEGNVMQATETFGGKLTSVQRRKAALERREVEMKKKADPRSSMLKTKWEVDEASHTYTKKMVDAQKNTPMKKLSDLP